MKKLLLIVLFLSPFVTFSQVKDSDLIPFEIPELQFQNGEIVFREVMVFEEDQKKLHSIALKVISELYRNSSSVIDLNDLDNGTLIVKGTLPLNMNGYYAILGSYKPIGAVYKLSHVLRIESKDNRIRVSVDKFSFSSAVTSDGQNLVFNPENKLDENYVKMFKEGLNIKKPKKTDIANSYNKSIIINELSLISRSIIDKIKEIYNNELNDDW